MSNRLPDPSGIGRRDFARIAFGTIGAAAFAGSASGREAQTPGKATPGIKLCVQSSPNPSEEQLLFLKQLGAGYVSVGSPPDLRTAEGFMQIKKRYADAGITVWNIGNISVHNMPEVTLNLPGRDAEDRGVQAVPAQPRQGGHRLHHLRAHGQRHLDERPDRGARRVGARVRSEQPRRRAATGTGRSSPGRCRTAASSPRKRSGRTTPTSSSRSRRSRKRRASGSAFIPTIRRCRCWPACRAASSATSTATSGRWRSPNSPNVGVCLCCGTWLEGGKQLTGKDPRR